MAEAGSIVQKHSGQDLKNANNMAWGDKKDSEKGEKGVVAKLVVTRGPGP